MSERSKAEVFLAVDLGASSGRVMAGIWLDRVLGLSEVHRFTVPSRMKNGKIRWDIAAAYAEVLNGLKIAVSRYGSDIVSIGVDTWAVDYGLLDLNGELLDDPICYRDDRASGIMERLGAELSREAIYAETGIQFLPFNTIYQLAAESGDDTSALSRAERLLLIPDLLNYWLTGVQAMERTNASTTQLLNPVSGTWSEKLVDHIKFDTSIFGNLIEPGTLLGPLTNKVSQSLGSEEIKVVAVASHDTASAFVALPSDESNYAILSSGTWSIMGLELSEPILGKDALEAGFSNEIGFGGSVRFLKNICGLWLIEESFRHWKKEGFVYDYADLSRLAEEAEPLTSFIDPDASCFASPGNIPSLISKFCEDTGQMVPKTHAQIVRCIFDSMVMKYRIVFEKLSRFASNPLEGLFVLGGGSRNSLLNQMTADALNVPVLAGPAEATAIGNIVVQMIADGELRDLAEARTVVGRSFGPKRFVPSANSEKYAEAFSGFKALLHDSELV